MPELVADRVARVRNPVRVDRETLLEDELRPYVCSRGNRPLERDAHEVIPDLPD